MLYPKLPPGYITKSTVIVVSSGLIGYGITEMLWGSETFYSKGVMPFVHRYIDGENSHRLAVKVAAWGLLPRFGLNRKEYPELECEILGRKLKNPIGLAAGFDKDGEAILPLVEYSGFGVIEIGSVTPIPQSGNPRPRVFRLLEDKGVINRYGFNSDGVGRVQQRVKGARSQWNDELVMFGVNLGKNKLTDDAKLDYEVGVNYFAPFCDYLVVNISSPNTPGLRTMQKKADLQKLMAYVKHSVDLLELENRPKVFLKIAPDLIDSEKKDIARVLSFATI
uniref:Dihydroorotate dehydrogenase (quinone), mitochondrial n=1 Tax=Heterorhabditis bacteriophora TaxID=37862 RepID=A0A1I7XGV1_HETBA